MIDSVSSLAIAMLEDGSLVVVILLSALSWLLSKKVAKRMKVSRALAFVSMGTLSAIFGLTLGARHLTGTGETYFLTNEALWANSLHIDANWILNVALFLPAGFFLSRLFRSSLRTSIGLALLSLAIEHLQLLTAWGSPDPADVVANFIGAFAGAFIARLLLPKHLPKHSPRE